MDFILVSGLEMTVSRCEIIISRFAITISHFEINFTTPSGINPLAATIKLRNSTINPHNSTIKPRNSTTNPAQLHHHSARHQQTGCHHAYAAPLSYGYRNGCQLVITTTRAADGTHRPRQPLRGERKIGGGCNKIGHKYNKSGTDCVNNVYYII